MFIYLYTPLPLHPSACLPGACLLILRLSVPSSLLGIPLTFGETEEDYLMSTESLPVVASLPSSSRCLEPLVL